MKKILYIFCIIILINNKNSNQKYFAFKNKIKKNYNVNPEEIKQKELKTAFKNYNTANADQKPGVLNNFIKNLK